MKKEKLSKKLGKRLPERLFQVKKEIHYPEKEIKNQKQNTI
jgi:hypothetical protein